MSWFKYFTVGFEIVAQIVAAAKDGVITNEEITQIVSNVIASLGIKIKT
jgi:hypothetical protein